LKYSITLPCTDCHIESIPIESSILFYFILFYSSASLLIPLTVSSESRKYQLMANVHTAEGNGLEAIDDIPDDPPPRATEVGTAVADAAKPVSILTALY
jgi:hypothetical protein